jgi:hypothetical protein
LSPSLLYLSVSLYFFMAISFSLFLL